MQKSHKFTEQTSLPANTDQSSSMYSSSMYDSQFTSGHSRVSKKYATENSKRGGHSIKQVVSAQADFY